MDLSKQYNNFADDFSRLSDGNDYTTSNKRSKEVFYNGVDFIKSKSKILDLACGDGTDMVFYKELGGIISGVDSSDEMLVIARNKIPEAEIKIGTLENIPFEDEYFDAVLSKYAIQTSTDLNPVFAEIHRVLKPGGIMMYLVTHPMRQYFERKEQSGDYFEQKIVDSNVFQNQITFKEPTHTFGEYLNNFLFKNFNVMAFEEYWDPSAEQIDGKKYPGFFIIKAQKK